MTVEGEPLPGYSDSPGFSTRTSGKAAAISTIVSRGAAPERLALVVASGPVCCRIVSAIGQSGTRRPIVVGSVGFMAAGTLSDDGKIIVSAPGQYFCANFCQIGKFSALRLI